MAWTGEALKTRYLSAYQGPSRAIASETIANACGGQSDHLTQIMDFLKSAVASAISKGPLGSYSVGDRVDVENSIWTLHNATKRVSPSHAP